MAQLSNAKSLSLKIGLDLAHLIRAKSEKFGDTPRKFYLAGVPLWQDLVNFNDFQILDFLSLKIGLDLAHFFRAKSENFGGIPGKFKY